MFPAQPHETLVRQTKRIAQRPEVLFDESYVEPVMARRHWCVSCECNFARDVGKGLVEVHAFLLHAGANGFEHREPAVAFVQVQNAGRDSHGFERAKTADAQQ